MTFSGIYTYLGLSMMTEGIFVELNGYWDALNCR